MMLNDVEYVTFKIIATQMRNNLFISFQLMFYKTLRYRLARALLIFNCSFNPFCHGLFLNRQSLGGGGEGRGHEAPIITLLLLLE